MTKPVLVAALLLAPTLVFAQTEAPASAPALAPTAPTPVVPQIEEAAPALPSPVVDGLVSESGPEATNGTAGVDVDASSEAQVPTSAAPLTETETPQSTESGKTQVSDNVLPDASAQTEDTDPVDMVQDASGAAMKFLQDGGPSIWVIATLSVITLTLILWKIWRLALIGAWSRGKAGQAVEAFEAGNGDVALATVGGRRGIRSKVIATALIAISDLSEDHAREETARVAKREIASARVGLGALELISTIAPLLGLLGTVLGMIAAFQALQAAGSKADPALLAGGIWEALLTTAAGMAVAIPASAALTWFESVIERIRRDIEDSATRLFVAQESAKLRLAAE